MLELPKNLETFFFLLEHVSFITLQKECITCHLRRESEHVCWFEAVEIRSPVIKELSQLFCVWSIQETYIFSFHDLVVHACKLLACGSLPSSSLLTPHLCPVFLCHACLLLLLCAPNVLLVIMFQMDPWLTLNCILILTHPNCSQLQSYSVM